MLPLLSHLHWGRGPDGRQSDRVPCVASPEYPDSQMSH
jgi:hypothetical protein